MSKSDSCLEHLDSRRNSGMEGETGKPSVTGTGHYQIKQSNGDVQNPLRQTVGDDNVDQLKGLTNLGPRRAWEELNNSEHNKEVMTNFVDSMTKEEHDKTTLIRHIGVPTKTPTSRPSPGRSRPTCPPCAVRINGKWVNLNKQPNLFVRIKERVARFFPSTESLVRRSDAGFCRYSRQEPGTQETERRVSPVGRLVTTEHLT